MSKFDPNASTAAEREEKEIADLVSFMTVDSPKKASPKKMSDMTPPRTTPVSYPEIVIDGITFILKGQWETESYTQVNIDSIRETEHGPELLNFWVYPSNSELGLWRLDVIENGYKYKGYSKGPKKIPSLRESMSKKSIPPTGITYYDYVQQTFIHLRLQVFINEMLHRIPTFDFNGRVRPVQKAAYKNSIAFAEKFLYHTERNPESFTDPEMEQKIVACVDDKDRQVNDTPFVTLQQTMECGEFASRTPRRRDPTRIIKEFSNDLQRTFRISSGVHFISDYTKKFSNIIDIQGGIYMVELERIPDPEYTTYVYPVNAVQLYFLKVRLSPISGVEFSTKIKNNVERFCSKDFHIIPFLLTTNTSTINEFGVYTQYIPCGAYVCKMFDYSSGYINPAGYTQCTREEFDNGQCNDTYSYVGDRYNDIYPFNELFAADCTGKGRKRRIKNRTKNRIKKYTKNRKGNFLFKSRKNRKGRKN